MASNQQAVSDASDSHLGLHHISEFELLSDKNLQMSICVFIHMLFL